MEESAVESTEETNEKKTLWDYYNKCISDDGSRRAQCILCKNIYNYSSTIFNLKSHLYNVHKNDIGDLDLNYNGKRNVAKKTRGSRSRTSKLWEHFSVVEEAYKIATCNYCQRRVSFKSTTCNLKSHLARLHPAVHAKCFSIDLDDTSSEEEITIPYDDESEVETKLTELSSYFERETGGRARCLVCRENVPYHHADLKAHLAEHPKLLNDQDSDVQLHDDEQETYTEVVYLEDAKPSDAKKEKKKWPTKWRRSEENTAKPLKYSKRKIKRRVSSSSDEPIVKKKKGDEEIRKFGEYIICLLEKLPRDVCMKMQMNIVNMIMNANLANTVPTLVPVTVPLANTVPIVQTVPLHAQPVSTSYVVLDKNHSEKSVNVPATVSTSAMPSGYIVLDKNHSEKSLLQNTSGTGSSNLNPSYSITIAPSSVVPSTNSTDNAISAITNVDGDKANKYSNENEE